jgi:L-fucose mutarotase/ribose pyranase (RbsD/FucU family)
MSISRPSSQQASPHASPKLSSAQQLEKILGPLDLDALFADPTSALQAGRDDFIAKKEAERAPMHQEQMNADVQEKLSKARFDFFKKAKEAYNNGFLTTSSHVQDNMAHLAKAAEGDTVFTEQTERTDAEAARHQSIQKLIKA